MGGGFGRFSALFLHSVFFLGVYTGSLLIIVLSVFLPCSLSLSPLLCFDTVLYFLKGQSVPSLELIPPSSHFYVH